jgi:hypothetical protein
VTPGAVGEVLVVLVCAAVWWIPTFLGLSDLQRRDRLPRPTVWRWTATLAVPVVGPLIYQRWGRPALDRRRRL